MIEHRVIMGNKKKNDYISNTLTGFFIKRNVNGESKTVKKTPSQKKKE